MEVLVREMFEVGMTLKTLKDNEHLQVGYWKASGLIVFDVKMNFTQKVHWVKDGHKTPDSEDLKYAGLVLHKSIRITLTYAALNRIEVLNSDIRNT